MSDNKSVFYPNNHCSYQNVTLALNHVEVAVKLKPNFHEAYFNLGAMFQNLKRSWDASKVFRHALDLKPNWDLAYKGLWRTLHDDMYLFDEADTLGKAAVKAGVFKHHMQLPHEGDDGNEMVFNLTSQPWHDAAKLRAVQVMEENMDEIMEEAATLLAERSIKNKTMFRNQCLRI